MAYTAKALITRATPDCAAMATRAADPVSRALATIMITIGTSTISPHLSSLYSWTDSASATTLC